MACQGFKQLLEIEQDSSYIFAEGSDVKRDEVEQTSGVQPFFVTRFDASTSRRSGVTTCSAGRRLAGRRIGALLKSRSPQYPNSFVRSCSSTRSVGLQHSVASYICRSKDVQTPVGRRCDHLSPTFGRAVLGHLLHRSSVWTKAQLLN